jgi:hypothetical protein
MAPSEDILYPPPRRTEFSDDMYSMIGRALAVANRFESSCKALALLLGIRKQDSPSDSFSVTRQQDFDELIAAILKRRLFQQIETLVARLRLPEEAKQLFHSARNDRNFIAHELTLGIDRVAESESYVETMRADLAVRVEHLAMADLAVCLLMILETDETLPTLKFVSDYAGIVKRWVCYDKE